MNSALYIDMSKAFEPPKPPGGKKMAAGRSSEDYDYIGGATPPKDGRSWESTGGASGGWKALKGAKGAAKPGGQEAEPKGPATLEERQISKDPNKTLSSAPGVESKQSILSGKKEDFSDHSVSDHYKILSQVNHDPKLSQMHETHIKDKTKGFTAQEHQGLSDELAQAHAENPSPALLEAATKHGKTSQDITTTADKTKADISAQTGQKELGRQVSTAKLDDQKEKLTIAEGEYTTDTHATHEEASAAHKKDKEALTQKFDKTKQTHKDLADKAKDSVGDAPKAADFPEGKVPPKAKSDYEKRKANAAHMKERSKQLAEEAKESHKENKDAHTAKKPKAADWKAKEKEAQQAEKEAAQVEEDKPQPPTTDLERAEVSGHTSKASTLLENINSHLDSGSLSDEDTQHLTSIRDALDEHQSLTNIPSKQQKSDLKLATALAGEQGKKPFEGGGEGAPAKSKGAGDLMGAFRSGRVAGEQVGEAAGSQEGGGAIGSAAINYAATGAVGAGHFLLNKDDKFAKDKYIPPTKSPKLSPEAKA